MNKYSLVYEYNEKYELVDLNLLGEKENGYYTRIDKIKDKDFTKLKNIDEFTTSFQSIYTMLSYLKNYEIIPNNTTEIKIISCDDYTNKSEEYKILFNEYQEQLNIKFIDSWLNKNKENYDLIISVIKEINNKVHSEYQKKIIDTLIDFLKKHKFSNIKEFFDTYNHLIYFFKKSEFYNHTYIPTKTSFKLVLEVDEFGKYIENYENIRNFIYVSHNYDETLVDEPDNNWGPKR